MGMLAMSRAIGDHFLRPYVIADPEVCVRVCVCVCVCMRIFCCIYIRCVDGSFGREITKCSVIYGAKIQFWPTLDMCVRWCSALWARVVLIVFGALPCVLHHRLVQI